MLELHNEKNTGNLNNTDQMELEQHLVDHKKAQSDGWEIGQPVYDVIQKAQSEYDIRVETMVSDVCEPNVGIEARDINLEARVEPKWEQSIIELTDDQPEMMEEIKSSVKEEKP
ncbi:unnamed protein product [Lactuca virosa]|uniref:Uncharacterized protein n=1 Tax=Lactuca virosa TaxID=75947 RepID=A0AAU9P3P1_9ASTR|nr:unnamed protein product [Lactuca virosa]